MMMMMMRNNGSQQKKADTAELEGLGTCNSPCTTTTVCTAEDNFDYMMRKNGSQDKIADFGSNKMNILFVRHLIPICTTTTICAQETNSPTTATTTTCTYDPACISCTPTCITETLCSETDSDYMMMMMMRNNGSQQKMADTAELEGLGTCKSPCTATTVCTAEVNNDHDYMMRKKWFAAKIFRFEVHDCMYHNN